jgi:glycerate kinase
MHPRISDVKFTAICDVSNPFYGLQGAVHVFGPQKGATPENVKVLDDGLRNFAAVAHTQLGIDIDFPGAGAGGGLGGGAKIFFDIQFQSGFKFLTEFIGLEELISSSDLVITGEGKMDEQTLSGKVVHGIAALAYSHRKPLIVIVGKNDLPGKKIDLLHVKKLVALLDGKTSETEAFQSTYALIKERVRDEVIPFFL